MDIFIIDHARERMVSRSASEEKVRTTVREGTPAAAKAGRQARERVFAYNDTWQGQRYSQKKVRAVCVQEENRLVVITVYVYYGGWER
jgi:hypothetical protein